MQDKIRQLLTDHTLSCFKVNHSKFECHFKKKNPSDVAFSEWKKDENSPAFFCEADVDVFDLECGKEQLAGMISLQMNEAAASPLSAMLFVKPLDAEKWQAMHVIIDIEF